MRLQRIDFESNPNIRYNFNTDVTAGGGGASTFFKSLYRTLLPLAKSAGKALNTTETGQAIKTVVTDLGKKATKDILAGESIKSVAKKHLAGPIKSAKRTALDAGLDIISDTLKGKALKKSARKRVSKASKKMLKEIVGGGGCRDETERGGGRNKTSGGRKKTGGRIKKAGKKGKTGGKCNTAKGGRKRKKTIKIDRDNKMLGRALVRQWM